ncbi:complex I 51 kDa subunit family protein [Crassaminicella profunda]|uniref:complex I 51 kDa subunit family protein n=1 Tax=Crassaminicella profunda TaxID=1286698 RepID=UPI001CA68CF0|nr:NADH-ubiquinone oxidoreductase-F iron-sulfur binding region domain-containing protein [Crassaminicella profunda]QZY53766.1 SLBB domain-containing protein [Crassaminicella profunda]
MNRTQSIITKYFNKDNLTVEEYIRLGGFEGLKSVLQNGKDYVISELKEAGLRGRGGAGYPTWKKWDIGRNRVADEKFIICNADEGEPGTFKDRELLDRVPYQIIEGMIISGYVFGAKLGFIYIREEYAHLQIKFNEAIKSVKEKGLLGKDILNKGFDFTIKVFSGAGAYVCGENSSLVESMEGRAGRPRIKPPRIGEKGYLNKPTLVNNVETLAAVPAILNYGGKEYGRFGTEKSKGTKLISLCGNIKNPGTFEVPFGITLREIIYDIGGGIEGDKELKFLQLGGASGALMPKQLIDMKYAYEDLSGKGFQIGSGAIVVADESNSIMGFLEVVKDFFFHESCGKCTPCREGLRQLSKILTRISEGNATVEDLKNVEKIAKTMKYASFCGLGQTAPSAILSAIKYFSSELCSTVEGICPYY